MNEKTVLQRVSEETMRFMRGNYVLDEVGDGKDELKFRRGGKTVLTIYIRDDRYDFLIIFGKTEREKFEEQRAAFPQKIQEIYDNSKAYHDGKWMFIPVADLDMLEAVKQMIMIKKKPNRKPFPKEQAVYGDCGHRCDLCAYYTGGTISDAFRLELLERIGRVYNPQQSKEEALEKPFICPGCQNAWPDNPCEQKKCVADKKISKCVDCSRYPCDKAVGGYRRGIEARSILADDVTWAILPWVDGQYGN